MVAAQADQEIPGLVEAALGPAVLAIIHAARGVNELRRAARYGPR
jgi:hypothetical protein